jgi:alanyl-tRNA synthetase
VVPVGDRSTLFATAGIQYWRPWVLAADPASDPGRIGVQWCVRMNSLDRVGRTNFLTSFCMLSVVTRGSLDRREALERMLGVFVGRWGLPFARLAFNAVASGPLAPADTASLAALDQLGVPSSRIVSAARKWAHPFKPDGPAGPELFVLFDRTGAACQAGCGPSCACGRYVHFWNLEFLENRRLANGTVERAPMPFTDSAGSLEWVTCAVTRAADTYHAPPLEGIVAALGNELVSATRSPSEERIRIVADHARTIALLLASGIEPGPRAHGHVLRRLIRRALAILKGCGTDPALLAHIVRRAAEGNQEQPGFPAASWPNASLDEETRRFADQLRRMRHRFDRLCAGGRGVAAGEVFEMHATHGVPWEALEDWLEDAGIAMDRASLAALRGEERVRSRGDA